MLSAFPKELPNTIMFRFHINDMLMATVVLTEHVEAKDVIKAHPGRCNHVVVVVSTTLEDEGLRVKMESWWDRAHL